MKVSTIMNMEMQILQEINKCLKNNFNSSNCLRQVGSVVTNLLEVICLKGVSPGQYTDSIQCT